MRLGLRVRAQRDDLERAAEAHRERRGSRRRSAIPSPSRATRPWSGPARTTTRAASMRARPTCSCAAGRPGASRQKLTASDAAGPTTTSAARSPLGRHGRGRGPRRILGIAGCGLGLRVRAQRDDLERAAEAHRQRRRAAGDDFGVSVGLVGRHGRGRGHVGRPRRWPRCGLGLRVRAQRDDLERSSRSSPPATRRSTTSSAAPSPSRATRRWSGPMAMTTRADRTRARPTSSSSAPRPGELLHGRHVGQRLPGAALGERHAERHGPSGFTLSAATVEGQKDGLVLLRHQRPAGQLLGQRHELPVRRAAGRAHADHAGIGTDRPVRRLVRAGPERALVPELPEARQEPRRRGRGPGAALVPRPAEHQQPDHEPVGRDRVRPGPVTGPPERSRRRVHRRAG